MNKYIKHISLFATFITLSACETTGGSIGGLFPAPKLLKGEIKNSVYIAENKLFSISLPHKEDTYEYTYLQIKEQFQNRNAYVSFGPAALNKNIYRVEVTIRPDNSELVFNLSEAAPQIIDNYIKQLRSSYGTDPETIETKYIKLNDTKTYYRKMSQKVPPGLYMSNSVAELEHHVYVTDYNIGVGVVWVQLQIDPPTNVNALSPFNFAKSLKLLPNKALNHDAL